MIPLRDVIPSRTVPVVTISIIVLNALVFVLELLLDSCQPDPLGFQPGGLCAAVPGFLQGRSTNEFIIAFGLQVDTPSLANRLSMDDKMRDAFVQQAIDMNKAHAEAEAKVAAEAKAKAEADAKAKADAQAGGTPAPPPPAPTDSEGKKVPDEKVEADYRAFLADNGIIHLPSSKGYWGGFTNLSAVFGMLVTTLLLSLGAPFWYSMLAQLLQLRSVLAFKDDKQRSERQATTVVAPDGAAG